MTAPGPAELSLRARAQRKANALRMRAYVAWSHLAYRLGPPWRGKLRAVDHLTLPCRDLAMAEEFYVGLLGARVLMRVDSASLARSGRPPEEGARRQHLSLVLASGPRIDLFHADVGQPPPRAAHPHIALRVAPDQLLAWQRRLHARGVPTFGPTRLGLPGQASLYFNDPFGNHLELTTLGFASDIPVGPPDLSQLAYEWKPSTSG